MEYVPADVAEDPKGASFGALRTTSAVGDCRSGMAPRAAAGEREPDKDLGRATTPVKS